VAFCFKAVAIHVRIATQDHFPQVICLSNMYTVGG